MSKLYLITLTSPLAIRLSDGTTKLSNVIEADYPTVLGRKPGTKWLRIYRVWDSSSELMKEVGPTPIDLQVKETNIRCSQEVR